jgi:hypothetical protein
LLTLSSIIVGVAVIGALAAYVRARAASRRLDRLTESYWELRYESGQLKARVARLEVAAGLRDAEPESEPPASPAKTTFVPLSSLKK